MITHVGPGLSAEDARDVRKPPYPVQCPLDWPTGSPCRCGACGDYIENHQLSHYLHTHTYIYTHRVPGSSNVRHVLTFLTSLYANHRSRRSSYTSGARSREQCQELICARSGLRHCPPFHIHIFSNLSSTSSCSRPSATSPPTITIRADTHRIPPPLPLSRSLLLPTPFMASSVHSHST